MQILDIAIHLPGCYITLSGDYRQTNEYILKKNTFSIFIYIYYAEYIMLSLILICIYLDFKATHISFIMHHKLGNLLYKHYSFYSIHLIVIFIKAVAGHKIKII